VSELKILVVDDDEMLCRAVQRMLRPHEVTVASGGREALELVRDEADFDLVLCDVMMPELSGPELYNQLADVAPQLQPRVLFMTGGMLERIEPLMSDVPSRLIEKPFSRSELTEAVRQMVDALLADRDR
jgi:CheY-like chemotaxis protein